MSIVNPIWILDGNGSIITYGPDGKAKIFNGTLTNQRTYTYPDKSGTFAMTSDIPIVPSGISGGYQLLATTSLNANTTTDQPITLLGGNTFIPLQFVLTGATTSMTTAAGAFVYTGKSKSGTQVAYNTGIGGALSALTTASAFLDTLNNQTFPINQLTNTLGNTLYFSLTTGQGTPSGLTLLTYGLIIT